MHYERATEEVAYPHRVKVLSEAPPQRDAFAEYQAQRVFGSLDALRAWSIIAVVWHHAISIPDWVYRVVPGAHYGFLGVDLFFVLSGFLIVTLLSRERERAGTISLRHFYVRRSLRIFPLYYAIIAALSVLYVLRPSGQGAGEFWESFPYLLFYLTNWVPAEGILQVSWSLAAEEQFYLLWPPVERFAKKLALPILGGLLLLSQLIHFGVADGVLANVFGQGPSEPKMLRETTFTPILLGVLLAHTLHRRSSFLRLHALLGQRFAAPAALLALVLWVQFLPPDIRGVPRLLVHGLMLVLVATVVVREDHGLVVLCKQPLFVKVGALSYGIYLFHNIALGVVNKILEQAELSLPFVEFVLGSLLVYGMAKVSFRYYETPFLRLKGRFS